MEQAVNLFNKGLLSDTHPMVQGNDTLSDALNATFVTMNGNEVVLQNDMGNRRVDNAFLPSGYEPVGIKEYGGIIYVAAYNPITNRSLIGSFPSPERKIDSLDDKNLQCSFNFFEHFPPDKIDKNRIKFITTDSVLLPLSDETSLHAGDKFSIYCDDINEENWYKYVTNYYNTNPTIKKIMSRKNKELTLSVGILNSLNLFVDITHTLKRWKDNVPQKYDDSYFKDYIFNDGYFISSNKIEDPSNYTLSDAQLIKNRQVIEANTYAYKLVGPLYLKIQLNHIELFNFGITGDKNKYLDDGGSYKYLCFLLINATITYNCNDYSGNGSSDEYYKDLGDGIIDFEKWAPFDFYVKKYNKEYSKITPYTEWKGTKPIYSNGLYLTTVTVTLPMIDSKDLERSRYIDYFIGVNSGIPNLEEPYYIQSLSSYGTIDISKLNSGEINLKNFRFFNENENSTITYAIEAYPKIGQVYEGLSLIFSKKDDDSEIEIPTDGRLFPLSNGRNTIQINWKEVELEPRTLYEVKFKYYIKDEDPRINDKKRWLLTTNLFNDCYNKVLDFGEKVDNSSDELLRSKLKIELEFEDLNIPTITKLDSITSGKLIDNKNILKYMISDRYQIEDTLSCKVKIKNYELYPSNLSLNLYELSFDGEQTPINSLYGNSAISFDYSNVNFSYNHTSQNDILIKSIDLLNNEDNYIVHRNSGVPQLKYNESNILDIITCNTKGQKIYSLNTTLVCNNIIFASGKNKEVENGFTKIHSEHFRKVLDESTSYSGFFVSNKNRKGNDDSHLIGLVLDYNQLSIALKDYTDFEYYHNYNKVEFLNFTNSDVELNLNFNDEYVKELYDNMSNINSKYTFAYIFSAISTVGRTDTSYPNGEFLAYVGDLDAHPWAGSIKNEGSDTNEVISACILGYNPITCCKVWWRNPSGSWVLLNSFSGVFGGNNLPIYSLPEKVNDKFIIVGESNPDNKDFGDKYNSNGKAYYNKIYKNLDNEINFKKIHGYTYSLFGVNEKVLNQIMNFLDPHNNIVYCLYKNTNLNDLGLKAMDENNCLYTLPYSGNVIMKIDFVTNGICLELNGLDKEPNNNILNFYVDPNWKDNVPEHEIAIPILNNNKFEDIVNDTLNTSKISNFYIDGGEILDSNGNRLFPDTIYKIDNNKLIKLENPPYLTYAINNNLNSLVSTDNDFGQSSSPTRYLRANGDDDVKMSLEFFGGNLRTVNYTRFLDIS